VIRQRIRGIVAALAPIAILANVALVLAGAGAPPAAAQTSTSITFEGGGWGHAVGMSQWGAKGRADAGQTVDQIVGAYYPGTQITAAAAATVRVHLADTASTTIAVTASTTISGNSGTLATVAAGETVEVRAVYAAYEFRVIAPTPRPAVQIAANDALVLPLGGSPARLAATGNRYNNGRLVVRLGTPGTLQVVNDGLTMQQYLYGLSEVPSSWPVEALKAQALAGRTYATKRVQSPRSANYDILSTTLDQVYAGYEKQAGAQGSRWVQAVDDTNTQILTYNGAPIDALYSSSNGGYSEDSEYAFVTALPYLRANADPFDNSTGNPNFRWTRTYTGAELGQWLTASRSVNIGPITNYEVSGAVSRVGRIDRATVRLIGTTGTTTLTGVQFRNMINAYAPANRQLQSTLLFFRPIGSFDVARVVPGSVQVAGWAFSQGTSSGAYTHLYVNDRLVAMLAADQPRPDVAAVVPGAPLNTGWAYSVPVDRAVNTICAYGMSAGGTAVTLYGCRQVTVDTQPFGSLDAVSPVPGGVRVAGWTADPNTAGSTEVHVYVNGRMAGAVSATNTRADVVAAFPAYSPARGYDAVFPVDAAINTVCAYVINVGPGDNQLLGCRTVTNRVDPLGSIDIVQGSGEGVTVAGWAIDPDTTDPIDVHVYVGGAGFALRADGDRPDLAAAFPGYGAAHGFRAVIPAGAGSTPVCVYAINVRAGSHQLLGCRTVVVPADPFGSIDVVRATPAGIQVSGWAIDPNTAQPIEVHAYVGTSGVATLADRARPDVGAAFPASGAGHGFDAVVPGRAGQTVCLYAINTGPGSTVLLGCRVATA
jgi:SpoIID/LytB domain protein